ELITISTNSSGSMFFPLCTRLYSKCTHAVNSSPPRRHRRKRNSTEPNLFTASKLSAAYLTSLLVEIYRRRNLPSSWLQLDTSEANVCTCPSACPAPRQNTFPSRSVPCAWINTSSNSQ